MRDCLINLVVNKFEELGVCVEIRGAITYVRIWHIVNIAFIFFDKQIEVYYNQDMFETPEEKEAKNFIMEYSDFDVDILVGKILSRAFYE